MILVTGATGKIGSALLDLLTEQNAEVRALAHSDRSAEALAARGVEVVCGSYTDDESVRTALAGVEKLFLLTPSSPQQSAIEQRIIDHAKASGAHHIVYVSALGSEGEAEGFRLHRAVEDHLRASGLAWTILRPHMFMQNFNSSDLPTILYQGMIINPFGDVPVSFIDVRDIAAVGAAALADDRYNGQVLDLTGGEALTYAQAAEKLSARLGRPIQYIYAPPEAWRAGLIQAGVPEWYAHMLAELFPAIASIPEVDTVLPTVKQVLGRDPYTFDQYLDAHIEAFSLPQAQ